VGGKTGITEFTKAFVILDLRDTMVWTAGIWKGLRTFEIPEADLFLFTFQIPSSVGEKAEWLTPGIPLLLSPGQTRTQSRTS
jgi:hypothetical protein